MNRILQYWPPGQLAANIGVPGFASETFYNYFAFAFWTYGAGPVDAANIWADPTKFMGF